MSLTHERLLHEAEGSAAPVSIVSALEFRREQYGLSKGQFAKVWGILQSHYSDVLRGRRSLPLEATKRAYRIGVPVNVLLQP